MVRQKVESKSKRLKLSNKKSGNLTPEYIDIKRALRRLRMKLS